MLSLEMSSQAARLDGVFRALADPTRRAVLERLGSGPASTGELAEPFPMALPSFMQHLDMLQEQGLVTSRKQGRVRIYQLVPKPLADAEKWIASRRALWERRLDQLDSYLENMKE